MKKAIFAALALTLAIAASAQTNDELFQARLQFHQRNASQKHLDGKRTLSPTPADAPKDNQGVRMPDNVWFPGEWEEVKAIVTTVYYNYYPEGHENDQYWTADPLLGGYADYYHYQNGWQEAGMGRYTSSPDTSSQQFSKVFYYLIDAIQAGGAESWVRVEHLSDSNIIKRHLHTMGLRHDNMRFIEGYGNSFWYRDCGPIAFYYGEGDTIGMMDFMYYPGRALDDSLPHYIEQQMGIPNFLTTIEWEGGNCLVDGAGRLFTSDAIMDGNGDTYGQLTWDGTNPNTIRYTSKPSLTRQKVIDSLNHIMAPRGTSLLPAYIYDGGTGHIDLYADMWDENEFVFSLMPDHYSSWTDYMTFQNNVDSLLSWQSIHGVNYKARTIPFPCTNDGGYFSNQRYYNNNFTRTYSNHTFVNNLIIQPVFSNVVNGKPTSAWDLARYDSLYRAYPGYTLYPINVASFDGSGGAIHCITKQIPADSPIRILHQSITGHHPEFTESVSVAATITNNTGIAEAKLYYRVENGDWQQELLHADDPNEQAHYSASVQFPQAIPDNMSIKVDYYLSATSNGGKTITKPMTAAQGGYYTFYLGTGTPAEDTSVVRNQPVIGGTCSGNCYTEVGIAQVSENGLGQFYPNPADGQSSIEVSQACQMQVLDLMGRVVYQNNLSQPGIYSLNTSRLAKGLYNVVFTTDNSREVRKLMVR